MSIASSLVFIGIVLLAHELGPRIRSMVGLTLILWGVIFAIATSVAHFVPE